jgi:hypothetical protein
MAAGEKISPEFSKKNCQPVQKHGQANISAFSIGLS